MVIRYLSWCTPLHFSGYARLGRSQLIEVISRHGVTHANSSTHPGSNVDTDAGFETVGVLIVVGEPPTSHPRLRRGLPVERMFNAYGPQRGEHLFYFRACAIFTAIERLPIGRPISNTPGSLLNDRMDPGASGCGGRAVLRWSGSGARLPEPAGTERLSVSCPVRLWTTIALIRTGGAWRDTCRDGTIDWVGKERRPGQDPWFPYCVGRDRGAA